MRSILEDVLKYDWQCYTDPLDLAGGNCPSPSIRVLSTRGHVFGIKADGSDAASSFANYSPDFPYVIPSRGRWGNGRGLSSRRSPWSLLLGPNSVLREIAERWEEFESESDFERAMHMADEILGNITSGGRYNGIPYHEVSLWQAARDQGFDSEELKLHIDQSGPVTPYVLHTHLERLASQTLREAAMRKKEIGYSGLVVPVEVRGGVRRRAGMSVLYEGLLKKAKAAGVRIFYNQRVGRIERGSKKHGGEMVVHLVSGHKVRTSNVFVNSGKKDVEALGIMSEPVASADEKTRHAIARILPMPGTKTYCFWEDAWWVTKLNLTSGSYRLADGTLYQGRYHDGDVVCTKSGKCRGALLVSYASGAVHSGVPGSHVRSFNSQPYVPLVRTDAIIRLVPGEMSDHEELFFDEIHRQIRNAHRSTFARMGYDRRRMFEVIPKAKGCFVSDFREFGHQVDIGAGRGGNDNRRFMKPVSDLNITLVNEGWSEFRGWSEGSFITAERALFHQYGLERPRWLDPTFHRSVIELFNRGQDD